MFKILKWLFSGRMESEAVGYFCTFQILELVWKVALLRKCIKVLLFPTFKLYLIFRQVTSTYKPLLCSPFYIAFKRLKNNLPNWEQLENTSLFQKFSIHCSIFINSSRLFVFYDTEQIFSSRKKGSFYIKCMHQKRAISYKVGHISVLSSALELLPYMNASSLLFSCLILLITKYTTTSCAL